MSLKIKKKIEKILIFKRIISEIIAIIYGKGVFTKNKGSICNIPIEAGNICSILPRTKDSTRLIG